MAILFQQLDTWKFSSWDYIMVARPAASGTSIHWRQEAQPPTPKAGPTAKCSSLKLLPNFAIALFRNPSRSEGHGIRKDYEGKLCRPRENMFCKNHLSPQKTTIQAIKSMFGPSPAAPTCIVILFYIYRLVDSICICVCVCVRV